MLCTVRSPPKRVVKEVEVYPPVIKKTPKRLIPKIIHQTWFEHVNSTKYPKMSRLIESWKQEGWEYRFYDDVASAEYIKLHFPREFLEAYDALIPGKFNTFLSFIGTLVSD
jgi:mannosyltransferase OCH1-like enzyme